MQANGAAVIAVPTAKMVNHAAETNLPIFFFRLREWWSFMGGGGNQRDPWKNEKNPTTFVKMWLFNGSPVKIHVENWGEIISPPFSVGVITFCFPTYHWAWGQPKLWYPHNSPLGFGLVTLLIFTSRPWIGSLTLTVPEDSERIFRWVWGWFRSVTLSYGSLRGI